MSGGEAYRRIDKESATESCSVQGSLEALQHQRGKLYVALSWQQCDVVLKASELGSPPSIVSLQGRERS